MDIRNYASKVVKKQPAFNIKLLLIGLAPLIPALILFIISEIDYTIFENHPWINQVMFWILGPFILWSLFSSQKNNLVGNYGETILLLIPTFIWLLPGHHASIQIILLFSTIIILFATFIYFVPYLIALLKGDKHLRVKYKISMVLYRLAFALTAVVSTLIISILLINWADHSMHFGYVYDNNNIVQHAANGAILKDFGSSEYITFLVVATLFVALLLVSIGLISSFDRHFEEQNKVKLSTAISAKIEQTTIVQLHKRRVLRRRTNKLKKSTLRNKKRFNKISYKSNGELKFKKQNTKRKKK